MTTGRANHTATMLNNGKVLIAGGYSQFGQYETLTTDTAELFDPANEMFTPTGSMADLPYYFGLNLSSLIGKGRAQHTATLLNDGTVLFAGGFINAEGGTPTIAASYPAIYEELYDPSAGTFGQTGALLYPRVWDTATLLNDGTVLFAGGGWNATGLASLAPNELYDPVSKNFIPTGNLQYPRYDNTATLLTDGNVLVAGGLIYPSIPPVFPNAAELYRPLALTPPGVTTITVTPASSTIPVGTSLNMIAIGNNGQQLASVTWSSSNTAIVTVTNDSTNSGTAYAVTSGAVIIQACAGNVCGSTQLTVQ